VKPVHHDVLIVGAGLSGIGAAYHLQKRCPGKTFTLLEARSTLGGTWDLFRYPGVRSDSDMYTLGFSFRPWTDRKTIASGETILQYLRDTAAEYGIDRHIRYGKRVRGASWSTQTSRWTVEVEDTTTGAVSTETCGFLYVCAGYYHYDAGYTPEFRGIEAFGGRVIHPQDWPRDFDYEGKRVVVIGSGATAVTLVPELAKQASHVTMLQRSPTYIVVGPSEDPLAKFLSGKVPPAFAHALIRWKNVLFGLVFFNLATRFPRRAKAVLLSWISGHLGGDRRLLQHFTPSYNPWEQRLCLVPDGDLFDAVRGGTVDVVTDRIAHFTGRGIRLESGGELEADVVVTATGLRLKVLGGLSLAVDGRPVEMQETTLYKGMMLSGVPNLAYVFGYTNASWTLKCELTSEFMCRILNHLEAVGCTEARANRPDASVTPEPMLSFSSGYVQRTIAEFPRQGSVVPYRLHQNYALDLLSLRHAPMEDGVLQFSRPPRALPAVNAVPALATAEPAE